MQKKLKYKHRMIILTLLAAFLLAACGSKMGGEGEDITTDSVSEQSETSTTVEETAEKPETTDSENMTMLCGEWILAGYQYEDTAYIVADEYMDSQISIYDEDGRLYADYYFSGAESQLDISGMDVVALEDNPSAEASEELLCAALQRKRDDSINRTVTLLSEKELLYCETYTEPDYEFSTYYTYFREGSEELADVSELRYRKTVTVETVEELTQAIESRTKIILKEGVYNFSELDNMDIRNGFITKMQGIDSGGEYWITGVRNLCLEAEEGAKVTICIENPYAYALAFESCEDITLRGLTCGHLVEPGHCTGSVVNASNCYNFTIEGCRLYGSGTYGVEGDEVYGLTVTDTEILDCTYGLVSLRSSGDAEFRDCSMHDSEDFFMFEMISCVNIVFDGCEITGNRSDYGSFIDSTYSNYISFRNCAFNGNTYEQFLNEDAGGESDDYSIAFENCTVDGEILDNIN